MATSNLVPELKTKVVRGIELPIKNFPNADFYLTSLVPDNFVEHCKYLKEDFIVREDDVYICTYPRSGTNWTHEIVRMLLNGKAEYVELFSFLEILPAERLENMPSPRVFCSHLPYSFLPPKITEKAKLIHVSRNPKDIVVSLHNVFKNISEIGDWKNWYTVSQNEKFDILYEERMKNSSLKYRFT
ncbi:hypothetical protein KUTeg_004657 [Tegillarca granosa]|uniref:Sulfotransferase domain-containing protein n=1 Tax=Tegillarca granosa TaxID=220873 RepID=A0ABQ9FM31_TEGGR|nr:hypothetical protein KUTeg_004657 [Tegillarca granosa]